MVKARRFIVAKHFQKNPEPSDLQLIEEELPSLHNGGKDFNNSVVYVSIRQMKVDVTRFVINQHLTLITMYFLK